MKLKCKLSLKAKGEHLMLSQLFTIRLKMSRSLSQGRITSQPSNFDDGSAEWNQGLRDYTFVRENELQKERGDLES